MKNLTVIGESFIDPGIYKTDNRSFNEILLSYSCYFDQIHYIGPGHEEVTLIPGIGKNIRLSTIASYAPPLRQRLAYYLKYPNVKRRFLALLEDSLTSIVQLRIPSVFAIAAYPTVKKLNLPLTTYIAGDWLTSFSANYSFPGNYLVGKVLDHIQRPIIQQSIPVTAGPILARQYSDIAVCHPYFSTTHRRVFRKKLTFPPENLLFVGRIEPLKRVEDAIAAVDVLQKREIKVKLSIIGDGVMRSQLEQLVVTKRLTDRVFFKGYINDEDRLKDEYINADILVFPSISEGTPKVLPEAMSYGVLPIAVAGTGSNDFIINHGKNGFLVPPKSPETIAETIQQLWPSQKLFQTMVSNGYQYASEHTLDKEVNKMWQFVFSNVKI